MSNIEELASSIQKNILELSNFLRSGNLPFPSFDQNGPVNLTAGDEAAGRACSGVIASCLKLVDLLQGPDGCLFSSVSYLHKVIACSIG